MYHHTPVYTNRPLGQLRPLTLLVAGILLSQVTPAGAANGRNIIQIDNTADANYVVDSHDGIVNAIK